MDFKKGDTIFLFGEVSKIIKANKKHRKVFYDILFTKSNFIISIESNILDSLKKDKKTTNNPYIITPNGISNINSLTATTTIDYNTIHFARCSTTYTPWEPFRC